MKSELDKTLDQYEEKIKKFCDHNGIDNPIEFAKKYEIVECFNENLYGGSWYRFLKRRNGEFNSDSYLYDLSLEVRSVWTHLVGFVILDKETIKDLAEVLTDGKKILEVCCGSAAMAKCLNDVGFEVTATDNFSWQFNTRWQYIENLDAIEAVNKYGKDVNYILISWPNYDTSVAYDVLMAMREVNPDCKLIYIGEDEGGCTANDEFFESINTLLDDRNIIKNFDGIHDHLMICN